MQRDRGARPERLRYNMKYYSEIILNYCLAIALLVLAYALLNLAFILDPGNKYNNASPAGIQLIRCDSTDSISPDSLKWVKFVIEVDDK